MKKTLFILLIAIFACTSAQAQLGGLVNKVAKKTAEKVSDKASDAAASAIGKRLGLLSGKSNTQNNNTGKGYAPDIDNSQASADEDIPTLREVIAALPEIPTGAQLVSYKEATLRNQSFKLLASPVTLFLTNVYTLGAQATGAAYATLDTNGLTNALTSSMAAMYGLTPAEMKALENMSDEEQEAFLMAHYQSGRADAMVAKQGEKMAKIAEELEPITNKIDEVSNKVDKIYENARNAMRPIYMKYKDQLYNKDGEENIDQVLKYYRDIVDIQRNAVQEAMNLRLKEQLPLAEEADNLNQQLQKKNPDSLVSLINYTAIFSQEYFGETTKLLEVPMDFED